MTDKDTPKAKTVFWADPERTFGEGLVFGDEVTGLIDAERQAAWLNDGTLTEEKPESVAHASQNKLAALEIKVEEQAQEIIVLEKVAKSQPKAKAPSAALKDEKEKVSKLEDQAIDWELKVDYLTEMVQEMAKTWTDPKAGKK